MKVFKADVLSITSDVTRTNVYQASCKTPANLLDAVETVDPRVTRSQGLMLDQQRRDPWLFLPLNIANGLVALNVALAKPNVLYIKLHISLGTPAFEDPGLGAVDIPSSASVADTSISHMVDE
jgi:hypothetical protein